MKTLMLLALLSVLVSGCCAGGGFGLTNGGGGVSIETGIGF